MLRDSDTSERRIEKLSKITAALMQRLARIEESRGPAYALTRATAVLEQEIIERNRDLEATLSKLAAINEELTIAREIADQANRAKSRFLRAASHDLLQPLSAAKLFLSHLDDMSKDSMHRKLVSHIATTIDSAEELIHALANIAKLDSNSFQMKPAPVSISRLFRRLNIDMQLLASDRNIDLRFVSSRVTVKSDPVYLRQIAQNLIANALKYTTGKKVLVGSRHSAGYIWLEVLDQGPGINFEDQEKIFNEFERLSKGNDDPGTGLGLSIVRRACEQLGHELVLQSISGRGSRFRVCLPEWQNKLDMKPAPSRETTDPAGRNALIVEDDPIMRKALCFLLTGWNMKVTVVQSIESARKAASAEKPDIVLTDYRLSDGETGIKVLEALHRDVIRNLPALILSAEPADEIRSEIGCPDILILQKPVVETELYQAIQLTLKAAS